MNSVDTGEAARFTKPSFQRILCAVDFSRASVAALDAALIFARQGGASITLLHVLEDLPSETIYSGGRARRLIGQYERGVEEANARLRAVFPRVDAVPPADVRTVSGHARDAILAAADDLGADLIVLGSFSHGRIERAVVGSTAKGVVRNARCAVLVVPEQGS